MKLKALSILIVTFFIAVAGFSQSKHTGKDNLLFLLRNTEHVKAALKTIDQLQVNKAASKSIKPGKVVIIICGETVKEFMGTADNDIVQEAQRVGVTLVACGLSLKKFNYKKEDLMPGVMYVENGFIKAFELQKAGYLSVEL